MHTLLLVDDDRTLCHMFREYLGTGEFIVFETNTAHRSLEIVRQHKVDIVVLDIELPDGNGIEFISNIKKHAKSPIVVISGNKDPNIHVNVFEAGADDFVQKPFHMREMKARIHSHIRRWNTIASNLNDPVAERGTKEKICLGEWTLDAQKYEIFHKDNKATNLTAHEFQLLKTLIDSNGRVLKREDLCNAVKEDNYVPTPRAIDIKIARIRKKLGEDATNPQIIKTVRGVGYLVNIEDNPPGR